MMWGNKFCKMELRRGRIEWSNLAIRCNLQKFNYFLAAKIHNCLGLFLAPVVSQAPCMSSPLSHVPLFFSMSRNKILEVGVAKCWQGLKITYQCGLRNTNETPQAQERWYGISPIPQGLLVLSLRYCRQENWWGQQPNLGCCGVQGFRT